MRDFLFKLSMALTPLFLAGVIALLYAATSSVFIQCKWGLAGCRPLTVSNAYLPNDNPLNKYPSDKSKPSSEVEQYLDTKIKEKVEVDSALERSLRQSADTARQIADTVTALSRADVPAAEKTSLTSRKAVLETTKSEIESTVATLTLIQTKLDTDIKALQGQLTSIHTRKAKIYWNRAMYATFVALFIVASLASIATAAFIIHFVFSEYSAWLSASILALAAGLSAGAGAWLYFNSAEYFLVINEVTNRIRAEDAANIQTVTHTLNSFGYAVTTGLVLAVAAVLWLPKAIFTNDPLKFDDNVKLLASRIKFLRIILYAGASMLLIAMFRMNAVLDWAIAFLMQDDVVAAKSLNQTLMSAQGSFYTLLLAAVYIPASYIILYHANKLLPPAGTDKSKTLSDNGLTMTFTSFKEYVPRLGVMLLPFLLGPVAEIAKNLFV